MSDHIKLILFLGDVLFLNLSILASFYICDNAFWVNDFANVIYLIIYSNLSWLFLVLVSTPYNISKDWVTSKIIREQSAFIFIHVLVIFSLILFFNKNYIVTQIIILYGLFIPVFIIYRLLSFYIRKIFISKAGFTNYIILGQNELSYELRKYYLINPGMKYKFFGYFDINLNGLNQKLILDICKQNDIHEILCCKPDITKKELQYLINFGLDSLIKVKVIVDFEEKEQAIQLDKYDKLPGIDIPTITLDEPQNRFIKYTFDIVFSIIVFLLILFWLIPIIGILIKLDSKGPIFFIQRRNGVKNKPFGCIKFRTMVINNEADSLQAAKSDPRITRIGKFLRKSSVDELPQFLNILKGDMSLIGPRPHPIKLNEKFIPSINNIMSRHYVKPGITGLAQCLGYRGETKNLSDMKNRIRLDRYYIENWSFGLDLKIIFLTIISLIRGSDNVY